MKNYLLSLSQELREESLIKFADDFAGQDLRIMLHHPPNGAIKYLIENWALCLEHMGTAVRLLPWHANTREAFEDFRPNVFITVACDAYMSAFDKDYVIRYMSCNRMKAGGIVSVDQDVPGFDFYIDWNIPMQNVQPSVLHNVPLFHIPFGCNPIIHYMRDVMEMDTWFFCGTNSGAKTEETRNYLHPIKHGYPNDGILAGIGWNKPHYGELGIYALPKFYSACRINLNYHRTFQLNKFNEVNERTYIIPACGGFQLTDNPKAMQYLFNEDEMVVADSPKDYKEKFEYYFHNPSKRYVYIEYGMKKVMQEYTYFHSLRPLLKYLR